MGWSLLLAVVAPALLAWRYYRWYSSRLNYDVHKIPGPPGWPIVGNLRQLYGTSYMHRIFADWANVFGPIYKLQMLGETLLVISDPEVVLTLCSREVDTPKFYEAYSGLNPRRPHDNFLVTQDYEEWKHVRKTAAPAFSPDSIRKMYPKIHRIACQAAEVMTKLAANRLLDVGNLMQRATAEVISEAGFEEEMDNLKLVQADDGTPALAPAHMLTHMKAILESNSLESTNPMYKLGLQLCPLHPKAKAFKASQAAVFKADDRAAAKIRDMGPQPDSDVSIRGCMSRLVNYKTGRPMDITKLAANANVFFFAGYETTSHLLTFALFELAAYQDLQDSVRRELQTAGLASNGNSVAVRDLEYSDLSKLPLLEAVLKEALRLHCTAPMGSVRQVQQDTILMGFRIPKKTVILMPPYAQHLSKANYIEPAKFWPERWLIDGATDSRLLDPDHPDATPKGNRRSLAATLNTFSSGPRNCIGQNLAMAEARTMLAVLLSRLQFQLPEGVSREAFLDTEEVNWVTLQPRSGLLLKVHPLAT